MVSGLGIESLDAPAGAIATGVDASGWLGELLDDALHSTVEPVATPARVGFAAQLLAGAVPPELEAVFDDAGVSPLPQKWSDMRASFSCPDWENPCKHLAATLYVFADRLDADVRSVPVIDLLGPAYDVADD